MSFQRERQLSPNSPPLPTIASDSPLLPTTHGSFCGEGPPPQLLHRCYLGESQGQRSTLVPGDVEGEGYMSWGLLHFTESPCPGLNAAAPRCSPALNSCWTLQTQASFRTHRPLVVSWEMLLSPSWTGSSSGAQHDVLWLWGCPRRTMWAHLVHGGWERLTDANFGSGAPPTKRYLFFVLYADIVNCDLKSTLRVLYNLFTKYRNVDWGTDRTVLWTTLTCLFLPPALCHPTKSSHNPEIMATELGRKRSETQWADPHLQALGSEPAEASEDCPHPGARSRFPLVSLGNQPRSRRHPSPPRWK